MQQSLNINVYKRQESKLGEPSIFGPRDLLVEQILYFMIVMQKCDYRII